MCCAFRLAKHFHLYDVFGFSPTAWEGGNVDVETEAPRGEVTQFPQDGLVGPGLE